MASVYQRERETVVAVEGSGEGEVTTEQLTTTEELVQDEDSSDIQSEETRNEVLQEIYHNDRSYDDEEEESFSITKFLKRLSVNLILPFINGLMLGFGEIIAHEIGFHYNWTGARVYPPRRISERSNSKLL